MFEMNEAGVVETLDYSKIPNAKNLLPSMKYPYGIGHIYSGNVVIYNPKIISPAPKGFKDWLDPKWGNKIGFIDIQYQAIMIAASMAATGGKDMNDIEKAKELLIAVKKAGARVYPTNEAFAAAMKNEEVGISAIWKARVVQWQNAGIPCEAVSPVEGIPAYVSGFVIQKNAPNKDNAYAYMNAMLEKAPQEAFAVDMGYNGTVTGLKRRSGPAEAHRLHARGREDPQGSRLRLPRQERFGDEGMVGQGLQGVMMPAGAMTMHDQAFPSWSGLSRPSTSCDVDGVLAVGSICARSVPVSLQDMDGRHKADHDGAGH
jgi:spermidine/putrescine-binding protein